MQSTDGKAAAFPGAPANALPLAVVLGEKAVNNLGIARVAESGVKRVRFALGARRYLTSAPKRELSFRSWTASLQERKVDALCAADDPFPVAAHALGVLGSGVRHLARRALGRPAGFNLDVGRGGQTAGSVRSGAPKRGES